MRAFTAGMRVKVVRPIYGWHQHAAEYIGRTFVLLRRIEPDGADDRFSPRWYFEADPPIRGTINDDAYNGGYLWVEEASLQRRGFAMWVADMEARWPREHA